MTLVEFLDYLYKCAAPVSAIAAAVAVFFNATQIKHLKKQVEVAAEQAKVTAKLAKQRATIDVVLQENADEVFQGHVKAFGKMREAKVKFSIYACDDLQKYIDENSAILPVINNYEFVSVGIRTEAFDEDVYYRMRRSSLIRDWDALAGYVMQIRENEKNHAIYCEFESLAKKWKSMPLNKAD